MEVQRAKFLDHQPPFIHRGRSRGRFAVGVRYERKVQEYLARLAGAGYRGSPWMEFVDKGGKRWCQPDALLIAEKQRVCVICEVKYQHTSDSWWQLKELYLPVLRVAMPGYSFGLCEIVHWHDPAVQYPEKYDLTPSPLKIPHASQVAVHIYNPRRDPTIDRSGGVLGDGSAGGAGGSESSG